MLRAKFTSQLHLNHLGVQSTVGLTPVLLFELRYHEAGHHIILVIPSQLGNAPLDPLSYHVYANL